MLKQFIYIVEFKVHFYVMPHIFYLWQSYNVSMKVSDIRFVTNISSSGDVCGYTLISLKNIRDLCKFSEAVVKCIDDFLNFSFLGQTMYISTSEYIRYYEN